MFWRGVIGYLPANLIQGLVGLLVDLLAKASADALTCGAIVLLDAAELRNRAAMLVRSLQGAAA